MGAGVLLLVVAAILGLWWLLVGFGVALEVWRDCPPFALEEGACVNDYGLPDDLFGGLQLILAIAGGGLVIYCSIVGIRNIVAGERRHLGRQSTLASGLLVVWLLLLVAWSAAS